MGTWNCCSLVRMWVARQEWQKRWEQPKEEKEEGDAVVRQMGQCGVEGDSLLLSSLI